MLVMITEAVLARCTVLEVTLSNTKTKKKVKYIQV